MIQKELIHLLITENNLKNFYFEITLDLQKSSKNSTDSCISFTQLSLILFHIAIGTMIQTKKLILV